MRPDSGAFNDPFEASSAHQPAGVSLRRDRAMRPARSYPVESFYANVSAMRLRNHPPMSSKWSRVAAVASVAAPPTGVMVLVTGLYLKTTDNHDALSALMGLNTVELVTGSGSGTSPRRVRVMASAHTFACALPTWPPLG